MTDRPGEPVDLDNCAQSGLDNLEGEFREYWGLDAEFAPDYLDPHDWEDRRRLLNLARRLAGAAQTLVLPCALCIACFTGVGCDGDTLYDPLSENPDSLDLPGEPGDTTGAAALTAVINAYRADMDLDTIPWSKSLTLVAQAHIEDLEQNNPVGGSCNAHSWSDKGNWTACCYTSDHAQAQCMWNKPGEITGGVYSGYGYEIATGASGYTGMTPEKALESWKGSNAHHQVILNQGVWASHPWKAIGAAYSESWAVVWFGEQTDPQGPP